MKEYVPGKAYMVEWLRANGDDVWGECIYSHAGHMISSTGERVMMTQVTEVTEQGIKHDTGKVRYDLLPPELLHGTSEVLTFGAKKYSERNWEKGMKWSRVFGALMRHLWTWYNPFRPDTDDETGLSHLWHASCCLAFLVAYEARGTGEDDRC